MKTKLVAILSIVILAVVFLISVYVKDFDTAVFSGLGFMVCLSLYITFFEKLDYSQLQKMKF